MSVGIDIVDTKRISLEEKFIKRILSIKEIELLSSRFDKISFLSGRWAAKEAFLKSLRTNIKGIDLRTIEVLNDKNGSPFIIYNNKKYENISISHEKEFAIAIAIID